ESLRAVDHAQHLDHALDAVQAAEGLARRGEQAETHQTRGLRALRHGQLPADLADVGELPVLVGAVAGEEEEVAAAHCPDVGTHRRREGGQLDAELAEPRFCAHALSPLWPTGAYPRDPGGECQARGLPTAVARRRGAARRGGARISPDREAAWRSARR